jgi:Zn-finger nucleic acid-binding protein
MKGPRCFLELIIAPQQDKKVDKCPKCKDIWLDRNSSKNMIDFTKEDTTMQYAEDLEDHENSFNEYYDNKLQNDYYYYKNHLRKLGS